MADAKPETEPRTFTTRPRVVPTRAGWMNLGLAVALGIAAANSGANVVFLISGVILGAFIVSLAGAYRQLTGITVQRRLPESVHAGQSFTVELALANRKRRPAHAVFVEDRVHRTSDAWSAFAPRVAAASTRTLHYPARVLQRGVVRFQGVRLSTLFPFGLVRASIVLAGGTQNVLTVFPALGAVRPSFLQGQLSGVHERASRRPSRIGATDIHGLREYRTGDNPKWIHWRRSASLGRPLVKEFDREEARRIHVVLDGVLPPDADDARRLDLERAISFAATLASAGSRGTREVGLTALAAEREDCLPASGVAQVHAIMGMLARLEPTAEPRHLTPAFDRHILRNTAVILVLTSAARLAGLDVSAWQAPGGSVRVVHAGDPSFMDLFEAPEILTGRPRAADRSGGTGRRDLPRKAPA